VSAYGKQIRRRQCRLLSQFITTTREATEAREAREGVGTHWQVASGSSHQGMISKAPRRVIRETSIPLVCTSGVQ